jgi:hypothetical protein
MPKGDIGEAEQRADGKWEVEHADGSTEVLSDKEFRKEYEVEESPVESEVSDRVSPRDVRPETHDADDAFIDDADDEFANQYCEEVETELQHFEDAIKNVRAELKSVKSARGERDFAALRHALHELSHGTPLSRTAHAVTVRHDGPERLQPAPSAEDSISSGPGEENNAEVRHFGR